MNHTSHKVVQMVTGYNNLYGEPKVWLALLIADFTAIWPFQLSFYICAFKTRHIGLTTSKVKSIIRTRTASAAKTSLRKWIRVCSIFISIIPVIQTYLLCISRRSDAMTPQRNVPKKVCCECKVFSLIKPIGFLKLSSLSDLRACLHGGGEVTRWGGVKNPCLHAT